jgi:hypothetical protein
LLKAIIPFYIICITLYIFFSRHPDYQDGEFTSGIIHYIKDSFEKGWNGFQLKIVQEVITLIVFSIFAVLYLKEPLQWKYAVSFLFILGAVYFAFK